MSQYAKLRVCASCEWIFKLKNTKNCPRCGFTHYGARFVYGNKCYTYSKTQKPWVDRKVSYYKRMLMDKVEKLLNNKIY